MNLITDLIIVLIVSFIAQTIVAQLKNTIKYHSGKYFKGKVNLKAITSIIISLIMCISYKVDIMVLVGLTCIYPVIGYILTALIVAGGSSVVHDLISEIQEIKSNKE